MRERAKVKYTCKDVFFFIIIIEVRSTIIVTFLQLSVFIVIIIINIWFLLELLSKTRFLDSKLLVISYTRLTRVNSREAKSKRVECAIPNYQLLESYVPQIVKMTQQ